MQYIGWELTYFNTQTLWNDHFYGGGGGFSEKKCRTEFFQKKKISSDDSTVSSVMSGLETRSLGLNLLGTT